MPDPHTIIPTVLKYGGKAAPMLLGWYYKKEKLDPFFKLVVSASGDAITYYSHSQEANCWLEAFNLSPFDFTIDRIKIEVNLDGASFSCSNTTPYLVKGSTHERVFIKSQSPMNPDLVARAQASKQARVNIEAHIITSIRSFSIDRHISDVKNVRVM